MTLLKKSRASANSSEVWDIHLRLSFQTNGSTHPPSPRLTNGNRSPISHLFQQLAVVAIFVISAPATAQRLEPAWEWSAPAGIEWAFPVGGDHPSAILAATRDGKLHQLHIIMGTPRFADSISIGKGARFVSSTADMAYVCNESEIIGVSVQAGPHTDRAAAKEMWRAKIVGEELPPPDGDPEFRTRLLVAIGVQTGVLAARSDGRIAELRGGDGAALWSLGVPPASEVRLFSDDQAACALHRGKSGIDATLIKCNEPIPTPKTVDLAEAWPMLAAWTGDGLIAAWPNRVVLLKQSGELRRATITAKWPIKSERAGILQSTNPNSRSLLALLDDGGRLSLHDVATGETVWEKTDAAFRNGRLEISGPHVLVLGNHGFMAAFHRDSPEPVARYAPIDSVKGRARFGDWQAASVAAGSVVAAFSQNVDDARNPMIEVLRSPVFRPGEWSAERARTRERTFSLGTAAALRKIDFSPGRVIVLRERAIQVFVMPTD